MGIGFQIIDGDGRLSSAASLEDAEQRLDDLLERWEAGMLPETAYIAELRAIVTENPDYIDGHAHLGHALLRAGKARVALSAYERGIALAAAAIPADYAGTLSWSALEHRA